MNMLLSETYHFSTLVLSCLLSLTAGAISVFVLMQRKYSKLKVAHTELVIRSKVMQQSNENTQTVLQEARRQLKDSFAAVASEALHYNNDSFLKLANETLKHHHTKSQSDLREKELSIANLVNPIKTALDKTEQQIRLIEKERKEAYGSLSQHLENIAQTQQILHLETRNLVGALRRPQVRGQWGELTLKRLAELAGMVNHCDFYEQQQSKENGNVRPDMIIRMPNKRIIIVDAKTPLDAYLNAVETNDEELRNKELIRHSRNVRDRIQELASKTYWSQFSDTPDFVVLFIPGDQFLSTAMDHDRHLLEHALLKKVVLSTPTSFVALLRAIAYGWRQNTLSENTEQIRKIGEDLYNRLANFSEYLSKMGKSIEQSTHFYNKAVASFDSRIIPSARKFFDLGLNAKKSLEPLQQVETKTRRVETDNKHNSLPKL